MCVFIRGQQKKTGMVRLLYNKYTLSRIRAVGGDECTILYCNMQKITNHVKANQVFSRLQEHSRTRSKMNYDKHTGFSHTQQAVTQDTNEEEAFW